MSTAVDKDAIIAALRAENAALRERQTARETAFDERAAHQQAANGVLKAMSASPGDPQPVFDLIVRQATKLLDTPGTMLFEYDGELVHIRAEIGTAALLGQEAMDAVFSTYPMAPHRGTVGLRALLDAKVVHVRDLATDPDRSAELQALPYRSQISVPMLRDGRAIGYLSTGSPRVDAFSDSQVELLKTFAEQAVIAITSAEAHRAQREALERQTATAEVLQVINASPGKLQPVFDAMLEKAMDLCEASFGLLRTFDGEYWQAAATINVPEAVQVHWRAPAKSSPGGAHERLVRGERVVHSTVAGSDEGYLSGFPSAVALVDVAGARTYLAVALRQDERLVGSITIYRQEVRPFTERQIALLEDFAAQAVIAIENARLLGELRERSAELAERNGAFAERIDHQAATIDVLKEMSSSPGNAQPVFDLICRQAKALLGTVAVALFECDGHLVHLRATHGINEHFSIASVEAYKNAFPMVPDRGSLTCRAILDGATIHIRDLAVEPGLSLAVRALGHRTQVTVPLMRDGKAIGAITTSSFQVDGVTDSQVELLRTFAEQAVIAITSAETYRALQTRTAALAQRNSEFGERIEQQAATIDVLKEMSASPGDPQPVFDLIVQRACDLCDAYGVTITEFDGELMHQRASTGVSENPKIREALAAMYPRPPTRDMPNGRAVLDRQIIRMDDYEVEHDLNPIYRDLTARSGVFIPLMRGDSVIGTVAMGSATTGGFSDSQVDLLKTFAEQAVIAIQSAETWRALQERTAALALRNSEFGERIEQQAATIDVLKVMSSTPDDTQPVFDQIVRRAKELCNSNTAVLFEYRDGLVQFRAIHSDVDFNTPAMASYMAQYPMAPTPDSIICRTILDSQIIHIKDIQAEPGLSPAVQTLIKDGNYRSQLAIPLMRDGQAIGCISLTAVEPGGFSDSQVSLLQTFAEQAVIAIGSVATFRALRERTAELAQRQNELRVTFENMGDGVAMFDETPRLVAWNRRFQDILDVPDAVMDERRTYADYIRYLTARGEFGPDANAEEQISRLEAVRERRAVFERARPNGRTIEVHHNPIPSGGFVLIYADITARKRAEAEIAAARDAAEAAARTIEVAYRDLKAAQANLVQAEKMASLGQLTAGIAHEIKNPLNFVNNFSSLSVELLAELMDVAAPGFAALDADSRADVDDLTATLTGNLEKIAEHGRRADGIVRSMLEHSRGASGERRSVDLNALVEEALNLAYHGARAQDQSFNITLERDFADSVAPITLTPQDMTRVLLNLFSNGFYAAHKRQTSEGNGFEPTLRVSTRDNGTAVEIHVRDNGIGVPADVKDKLFQPFFTTKPTGEGTGLGLSISYDIVVKQHGGQLTVDSEPNAFTEFAIILPRGLAANEGSRT